MEHADGVARRSVRDGGARRSPAPDVRRARNGVTAPWCAAAGVGLALTLAVGVATVAATLAEGGAADRAPTGAPVTSTGVAPVPSPAMLRLWGLRAGASGVLAPYGPADEAPRTALEQLYADLLPPPAS